MILHFTYWSIYGMAWVPFKSPGEKKKHVQCTHIKGAFVLCPGVHYLEDTLYNWALLSITRCQSTSRGRLNCIQNIPVYLHSIQNGLVHQPYYYHLVSLHPQSSLVMTVIFVMIISIIIIVILPCFMTPIKTSHTLYSALLIKPRVRYVWRLQ